MTDIGIRDISVSFRDNKISNISLVQGDALTRGFDISFVNAKGETLPVDDDYVVELIAVNYKDKDTPYACRHTIVDDKYRVMIPPEALSKSGSVTIQLVFYQKSTKAVIHTIKQKCPVYQSIGQEFVESNNLYVDITALRLGLEKIEKLDSKYEEIIEKDVEIQNNETIRKEAENKRNLEEVIRQDNEVIRNSNEEKREQLKTALVGLKNSIESDLESINLTVDAIVSSEDDRKQNEIVREQVGIELENLVADIQNKLDDGAFVGEKGDQGIQGEQGPQGPPGEVSQEQLENVKDANSLKIAKLEKELQNYKSTMANINVNQEVKQSVSGYGSVNLPKNAANGQVSVSVKGNTVADENGTKSTISASRLKSVDKDGLQESTSYLPNVGELRSLPNGVCDEVRVSGGKAELVKRVQVKTILDSDISNIKDGTSVDYVIIPKPINSFGYNIAHIRRWATIEGLQESTSDIGAEDLSNEWKFHVGINKIYIVFYFPKGTTIDVVKSKLVNHTLIYQLAEPIITPIDVSGTLLSNPSGTVYVEKVLPVAGIYTDEITIAHTDFPISSLDKVSKIDFATGVETQLDVSKAVVATDKLSFTHTDLTSGDVVFFEYFYANESTQGELELEYYDSRYVLKDSVTGKFYKIIPTVANGVLTNGLLEV